MEAMTWWQVLVTVVGGFGGFEFIKWLFTRKREGKQLDFELYERRIAELHASIDKDNKLNDDLLARLSNANAAINKHIDRNRELSDRLYKAEQEVNRVNDRLTEEQEKNAGLERELGEALRVSDYWKLWHCRKADCADRVPPNEKLKGKTFRSPAIVPEINRHIIKTEKEHENTD